jgi:predicted ATPase
MYIDSIKLKNIKGFRDLHFSLRRTNGAHSGWTVFTGDNGSGKSTLLKAISLGLMGKDTARSLQPSFHRWICETPASANVVESKKNKKSKSVRIDQELLPTEGSIELIVVPEKQIDEFSGKGNTAYSPFSAKLTLKNSGRETILDTPAPRNKALTPADRGLWANERIGWFSCGYGPFRRVFGASPDATRLMVGESTERFVTMFQEAASLYEVDQWMKSLHHKKLEKKKLQSDQLKILFTILRDDLMPNQITVDRVDSDGLWLKDRNGVMLAWTEMSDGYRSAVALLADIIRHLIKAYGPDDLLAKDRNGKVYIKTSGVVMIDEIDAHLHPEWQREIGFWLKMHFPNIQFLVTTHSPLVCQAADENGLFVLPEPGSLDIPRALNPEEYLKVISSKSDTILRSPAFGLQNTRSENVVEIRAQYSRLQSKIRAKVALTREEQALMRKISPIVDVSEES